LNGSEYTTPTDIANFAFCHRYFYINKKHPHHGKTNELTALGKLEHAVFEKYFDLTKLDWLEAGGITENEGDLFQSRISLILDVELNIGKENAALYADYLEKDVGPLRFRLSKLNQQKINQMKMLAKKKIPLNEAVNIALPWKIEQRFQSQKHGIRGFADTIYKTEDGGLVIEDLKSHDDRYDAFIHQEAHESQGITYAILAEENYGLPVKKFQILYTKDLSTEIFKVTRKSKLKILNAINESKKVLANGLPPMLKGDDAVKCQNCYSKKFCFALDKKTRQEELNT